MKYIGSLFTLLILSVQVAFGAGPIVKFIETSHEFGNVKEANGKVSYSFKFTNTGDSPLVVLSATTSCGCTKPVFPKEPVEPGDTAVIHVTYNPVGRPGEFDKNITVKTNSVKDSKIRLKISGVVIPK